MFYGFARPVSPENFSLKKWGLKNYPKEALWDESLWEASLKETLGKGVSETSLEKVFEKCF